MNKPKIFFENQSRSNESTNLSFRTRLITNYESNENFCESESFYFKANDCTSKVLYHFQFMIILNSNYCTHEEVLPGKPENRFYIHIANSVKNHIEHTFLQFFSCLKEYRRCFTKKLKSMPVSKLG